MEEKNISFEEKYTWWVQVQSETHLDDWLKDYFARLEIKRKSSGITLLKGKMQDLPEVYGLILKLRDSGVVLLSLQVERLEKEGSPGKRGGNTKAGRMQNGKRKENY